MHIRRYNPRGRTWSWADEYCTQGLYVVTMASSSKLFKLALICSMLLPCRILKPLETLIAIVVVSVVFVVSVWVGENGAAINNFKKQKPSAFIILIMVTSCILISMLGSILVFMWAITLPLTCKFGFQRGLGDWMSNNSSEHNDHCICDIMKCFKINETHFPDPQSVILQLTFFYGFVFQ